MQRPVRLRCLRRKGRAAGQVTPRGDWPNLPAGIAPRQFTCEPGTAPSPRAHVTVFTQGDEL